MALKTKSREEKIAEATFDAMQDMIKPEDEVPEGYESIEEVTDGVDLEALIKEDEEEEEDLEESSDVDEEDNDWDFLDMVEEGDEDDLEESSDDEDDEDDDGWNHLDTVEGVDAMVNSVHESLADKVNQITELMSDMVLMEHESGVYASDVMVDRMCDHIQKALDNLRPCLKKELVEEFKW